MITIADIAKQNKEEPEQKPLDLTTPEPKKEEKKKRTWICSYCGCEVSEVWIHCDNGIKYCRDCLVSSYRGE